MDITEDTTGVVRVGVYDISTRDIAVWKSSIISRTGGICVSCIAEFIVINAGRKSYVYNKDRALQYKVTCDQVLFTSYRPMSLKVNLVW